MLCTIQCDPHEGTVGRIPIDCRHIKTILAMYVYDEIEKREFRGAWKVTVHTLSITKFI